jgi:hypothetical protein
LKVGIVGSEAAKFTPVTEKRVKKLIRALLDNLDATEVVSGGCHLGGIDQWAAEAGVEMGLQVVEFFPRKLNWSEGYAPRNRQIAQYSDEVYCFTVDRLPKTYTGMTFPLCYHCNTAEHVKSGGCWTVKEAFKLGKTGGRIFVLRTDD